MQSERSPCLVRKESGTELFMILFLIIAKMSVCKEFDHNRYYTAVKMNNQNNTLYVNYKRYCGIKIFLKLTTKSNTLPTRNVISRA